MSNATRENGISITGILPSGKRFTFPFGSFLTYITSLTINLYILSYRRPEKIHLGLCLLSFLFQDALTLSHHERFSKQTLLVLLVLIEFSSILTCCLTLSIIESLFLYVSY